MNPFCSLCCSTFFLFPSYICCVFQSCRPSKGIKCNENNDITPVITFVTGNKKKLEDVFLSKHCYFPHSCLPPLILPLKYNVNQYFKGRRNISFTCNKCIHYYTIVYCFTFVFFVLHLSSSK